MGGLSNTSLRFCVLLPCDTVSLHNLGLPVSISQMLWLFVLNVRFQKILSLFQRCECKSQKLVFVKHAAQPENPVLWFCRNFCDYPIMGYSTGATTRKMAGFQSDRLICSITSTCPGPQQQSPSVVSKQNYQT